MNIYLQLFLTFLQIGAFAFGGGYAVLAFIEDLVVNQQGWLSMSELTDLVALSQITPGPIAINSATFIGTKVAGIPGAIVATIGNVTPQFILMMTLGYFIFRGKRFHFIDNILKGLKPAIVGLVAIATISMIESSLFTDLAWDINSLSLLGIIGFVMGFVFYSKKTLSVIQLIILSAVIGFGMYFIL